MTFPPLDDEIKEMLRKLAEQHLAQRAEVAEKFGCLYDQDYETKAFKAIEDGFGPECLAYFKTLVTSTKLS